MTDPNVICPVSALKLLPGESLKVYLALKYFAQQGGSEAVFPNVIATHLNMSESTVVLRIIHLCIQGSLTINLKSVKDFFDYEKLVAADWVINDVYSLTQPNADLLSEVQNMTLSSINHLINDGSVTELEVVIRDIQEESLCYSA